MAEEEARRIIDAVKRGEISFSSIEVDTSKNDEGRISSTVRRRCSPCTEGRHNECECYMCDCNHPLHEHDSQ